MKRLILPMAVSVLASGLVFGEPKVELAGLQVVWADHQEEFEFGGVMNAGSPVTLALVVSVDGKNVLGFSKGESKVGLKDGAGKDLKGDLWHFPKNSKDGRLLAVEVKGEERPAAGDPKLSLTGELMVLTGEKTATHKSGLMEWKKGVVPGLPKEAALKLTEAKKPKWGDDPWQVTFEVPSPPEVVKTVRFFDEKGVEIESQSAGSGSFGMFGKMTYTASFSLKKAVPKVVVEVKVYTDLEKVKVPLDLKVGG